MGTAWSEVIANYAMPLIDDERLTQKLNISPAAFFRTMSQYLTAAIPQLSRPPQIVPFLTDDIVNAEYYDGTWTSTESSITDEETVVNVGVLNADVFSCTMRTEDATGNVTLTPYSAATYNAESGTVTFPQQAEAGIEYEMDFYTDGSFANDISVRLQSLIGMGIAIIWDERFTRNWLDMTMKIHDDSFTVANESNYIKETTARLVKNRAEFAGELQKYEQDCAYYAVVHPQSLPTILI